jgi:hypothetical protein
MELSMFLAKLLGVYLLIIAIDMFLRRKELESAVKDFASSRGMLAFSGSTSLFVGLAIVIAHPVYMWNWQGLITLLGYLLVVRGILRLAFPSCLQKTVVPCFHGRYWLICLILLVIGAYLTYMGFVCMNPDMMNNAQ